MSAAEHADRYSEWNPRWVAFASSNGNTPEAQGALKSNAEFIGWTQDRWAEFYAATGTAYYSKDAHPRFDAWLAEQYPAVES